MKYIKYYLLALGMIVLDQVVKLTVHRYMELGPAGEIPVFGDWFKLHYTLNPGMAFGLQFGESYGKLALSLFRLVSMVAIGYYLYAMAKTKVHRGFLWCIALILGGAVGNVIDSTFYGVFLDNAKEIPDPTPFYPWFHGQVIDMFYVDIASGYVPSWVPLIGGSGYSLWPIFNIADASIFMGVATILTMQRKFFSKPADDSNATENPAVSEQQDATLKVSGSEV